MAATFVQLPDDSTNTGKKVRANDRVVGLDTVFEHFFILQDITDDTQARVISIAPTTEAGLVVRNIPSGTQTISGTVTANLAAGTNNIGDVDVLSVIPGTAATNLGKAEDGTPANGDTGVGILGFRNSTNTSPTNDGKWGFPSIDSMNAFISGVRRSSTILTDINTTYNTTATETNNSAWVDCSMFRNGSFCAIVTETGAATDITFTLQFSNDGGTTAFDYRVFPFVKYRFDDSTIAAHTNGQLKICEPFDCVAPTVRMSVTGTGLLSGTNEFAVASASFEFIN